MEQFFRDPSIYTLARGPLVWLAFVVFFAGIFYRVYHSIQLAKKEKVIYPYLSFKYTLRSIIHWLIPFGSISMRRHPWFTLLTFVFHICVILTPLFLAGHIELWYDSWKISWWSFPQSLADAMTLLVIFAIILLVIRRIIQPDVRFLTGREIIWQLLL